ncbi:predicted protein [Nematostella vectensis]|uniref:Uncharacterized protein n=1 Tax=Nematostella vectensis TaxID=45351 RepID=A7RXE6_NEMVE|nr:predicted protein [Nematostella vectensis]|eukprot:XP_001635825.1 predicted protein [Nematostella vectensis]
MRRALAILVTLSLIPALAAGVVEECPDGCACYYDFATVKCRDSPLKDLPRFHKNAMAKVAVLILKDNSVAHIDQNALQAAPLLTELDLRGNDLKSVPSRMFSQSKLRVLYLENNPFSCDPSTVHILHTEVQTLLTEDTGLEMFDGGRLKCADPPNVQGQKIIYLPSEVLGSSSFTRSDKESTVLVGYSALTLIGVALCSCTVTGLLFAVYYSCKTRVLKNKENMSSMEEGESLMELANTEPTGNAEDTLVNTLHALRRKSQGYPEGDIIDSNDEDAVEPETYIKEKLEQHRRHSLGYPRDEHSSDDAMDEIDLNAN